MGGCVEGGARKYPSYGRCGEGVKETLAVGGLRRGKGISTLTGRGGGVKETLVVGGYTYKL